MSNKNYTPAEFYKIIIKDGNYEDEIVGEDIRYMVKDGRMNMYHYGTPMAINRPVTKGEVLEIKIHEGERPRIIGENGVANMLPQVPVTSSIQYRSTTYNTLSESVKDIGKGIEFVNESVEDEIYNVSTDVPISRPIRKQLIKVLKAEEKLVKAETSNKKDADTKEDLLPLKRDVVFERKKLNGMKKLLTSKEANEFKKIEKAANEELKNIIKEKNKKKEECVEESKLVEERGFREIHEIKEKEKITDKKAKPKCAEIKPQSNITYDDANKFWDDYFSREIEDEEEVEESTKKEKLTKCIDSIDKELSILREKEREAKEKYLATGEQRYANQAKGFRSKIERKFGERADKKYAIEKNHRDVLDRVQKKNQKSKEPSIGDRLASMYYSVNETANIEDEIKPIVEKLNNKGYKVKYASPGHINIRKKEDEEPDGIYYGKLYTDARIMFDGKYGLNQKDAPKHWYWRDVDGCAYLDIEETRYNEKDGTPNEAFAKWKKEYMDSLRKFVDELKPYKTKDEPKEESFEPLDFCEAVENIINDIE